MASGHLEWIFPEKKIHFLRIERLTVGIITVIILALTYLQFGSFSFAVIFTLIFLGVYIILSYLMQLVRMVQEHYHFTPTHFEITRKSRFRVRKEKVPLKEIKHHKLDRIFLGGYLLSKKKKHLLYFNTRQELKQFEDFLKKHLKK